MGEKKTTPPASKGAARRSHGTAAVSALEFDAWLGITPAAAGLLAPDGRLLVVNAEFRAVFGIDAGAQLAGRHLREIAPDLWASLAPLVRWVAFTGARAADLAIRRRDERAPDGLRQWLVRLTPSSVAGSRELRLLVLDLTQPDTRARRHSVHAFEYAGTKPALDLRFSTQAAGLTGMRQRLAHWLEALGATHDEQSDIVLAAHEAAANAVQHAGGQAEVRVAAVARHGCVVVHIDDSGRWEPPAQIGLDQENSGRGLAMMQLLMDDVYVHPDGDGTHVRMQRQLCSRVGSTGAGART